MNFQEIISQTTGHLKTTWEKIKETPTYNQLMDRYENLTPVMQKLVVTGISFFMALMILSIPYSYLSSSGESIDTFESRRNTIRELLKVSREAHEIPDLPQAPSSLLLKDQINSQLKNAGIFPEQIKAVDDLPSPSGLIPEGMSQGAVTVNLSKLNLRQVLDVGYQLQNISLSVKVKDIILTASLEDPKYLDVIYKLVSLAVPEAINQPPSDSGRVFSKPRFKNPGSNHPKIEEDEE